MIRVGDTNFHKQDFEEMQAQLTEAYDNAENANYILSDVESCLNDAMSHVQDVVAGIEETLGRVENYIDTIEAVAYKDGGKDEEYSL